MHLLSKACVVTILALAFLIRGRGEAQSAQKTFQSPEAAVDALVKACRDFNKKELLALLGTGQRASHFHGDDVDDSRTWGNSLNHTEKRTGS